MGYGSTGDGAAVIRAADGRGGRGMARLLSEVEHALACAITQAESRVVAALAADDYRAALAELASLRAPIDTFFENTMVMDEDVALRENRLKLLNRFVGVFASVADFGMLAK